MTAVVACETASGILTEESRHIVRDGYRATLQWDTDSGVNVLLANIPEGIAAVQMKGYSNFLEHLMQHEIPMFDLENQHASVALEERGFVKARHPHNGEEIWVSAHAEQPWEFATPYLAWSTDTDFGRRRVHATLALNAFGLMTHNNPLRLVARWDAVESLEEILARAHNVRGHQVEIALVASDTVSAAAQIWRQDRRIEEMASRLTPRQHVKHSRIARILRDQVGSHSGHPRPYLHIIDLPQSKRVPLVALTNLNSSRAVSTLEHEGLVRLDISCVSRDEEWARLAGRQHIALWVADPSLFDSSDQELMGWYRRTLTSACRPYSRSRGYAI